MSKFLLWVIFLSASCNPNHLQMSSLTSQDATQKKDPQPEQATKADDQSIQATDEAVSIPAHIAGSYLSCLQGPDSNEAQLDILCSVRDKASQNLVDIYNLGIVVEWLFQSSEALKVKPTIQPVMNSLDYHVRYRFLGLTAAEIQELNTTGEFTVNFSENNIVVATAKAKTSTTLVCPAGYIQIVGDAAYQTSTFCVMKYEAKNVMNTAKSQAEGTPWVNISQTEALAACRNLGPNYALLSLNEWNTMASQIASYGPNWSLGSAGSGTLQRGHTDNNPAQPCPASTNDALGYVESDCTQKGSSEGEDDIVSQKRTHVLPNGEVIWDLAGNVYEWINYFNSSSKPTPLEAAWQEYPVVSGTAALAKKDLIPTNAVKSYWNDSWNSTQGIGMYYSGVNDSGGAMHRGGDFAQGSNSGVFAAALDMAPAATHPSIGFRCRMLLP